MKDWLDRIDARNRAQEKYDKKNLYETKYPLWCGHYQLASFTAFKTDRCKGSDQEEDIRKFLDTWLPSSLLFFVFVNRKKIPSFQRESSFLRIFIPSLYFLFFCDRYIPIVETRTYLLRMVLYGCFLFSHTGKVQ